MLGFELYRASYMKIWQECMTAGFTTVDARLYAELEMARKIKELRVKPGKPNKRKLQRSNV